MAHGAAPLHLEADQLSGCALRLDPLQRLPADEVLRESDDPPQAGFERIGPGIHVVSVQQVARFGPQAFPGRDALRHDAERPAHHEQFVPDPGREISGDHDLVASLAGVPGPADDAGHLRMPRVDARLRQPVVLQGGEIRPCDPLQRLPRFRPLQGEERSVRGHVAHLHVHAARVAEHPLIVLVRLGDVDDPDKTLCRQPVAHEVIDHDPALVAHHRIQGLVDGEAGSVVRDQLLHQR